MYNVLEKLRTGQSLSEQEREVYEQGLVGVLRQLHDELDKAVLAAYSWPEDITDELILENLVVLNRERRAEEMHGVIHWLVPGRHHKLVAQKDLPDVAGSSQPEEATGSAVTRPTWPAGVPAQLAALKGLFANRVTALTAEDACGQFRNARRKTIEQHLETLASLGLLVCYEVNGITYWHG